MRFLVSCTIANRFPDHRTVWNLRPEYSDCGTCHFYRPDWKYQYCVYAECPYQPGKLTAHAAVKFTVKGADNDMALFRVEKNKGYTVMSNHHLRNKALSLKAKGLLS